MDISLVILAVIAAAGGTFFLTRRHYMQQLQSLEEGRGALESKSRDLEVQVGVSQTYATTLQKEREALQTRYDNLLKEKDTILSGKHEAEKQKELARQETEGMRKRIEDFEGTKQELFKSAKEAMFETGSQTFTKLAEEMQVKTREHFDGVVKSVAALKDRVGKSESTVETVYRALSSPGAAGSFSEIGMENALKNLGLTAGRDFITQFSMGGEESGMSLRPDAVVFLPGGNLLVLDSKASKFFLDLAEAEGTPQEADVKYKLLARMREHVKGLDSKGYRDAIQNYYKKAGRTDALHHVMTVMFLQSEAGIERLCKEDPAFRDFCESKRINLAGPTGLYGLLSLAHFEITREQQQKNLQAITAEVGTMLSYVETMLSAALKVGKGIRSAAESYEDFVRSVNSRFLPKARSIQKLGVELPKNKSLPANLPGVHVSIDDTPLIEGESENVTDEGGGEVVTLPGMRG